ncbi:MAG: hypothetical protein FJZ97_01250 [Chloroflexi bacterium]|nr:hypothetical protein [Chloroflexota bacterium]
MLVLSLAPKGGEEKIVRATATLRPDQFGFVEWRMRLGSEYTGQHGDMGLSLTTSDKSSQPLLFSCFVYRDVRPRVGCEVWGRGSSGAEYATARTTTLSGYWHTLRIEISPEIRATFFVDGQEVGSYMPPDAEGLKGKLLSLRLSIYNPEEEGIMANFDDVRIGNLE